MRNKTKQIACGILISLFSIGIFLFLLRATIAGALGKFMAPVGDYSADVAILEGNQFIDRSLIMNGVQLFASGKVRRVVVVLFLIAPSHRPFAINEDYPKLVKKDLQTLGLREGDFRMIVTRIHPPITLTSAKGVIEALSKENVKSAVLLSPGFHTRRSFLVYQYLSIPYQIKIFPSACFNAYPIDSWWSQDDGLRDFTMEVLKLAYYMARGYIPFKLSYD